MAEKVKHYNLITLRLLFWYCVVDIGYEEIDWYYPKGQSGMYYSLFGAYGHNLTVPDERVPLMIWLQGGPGASSQFGAFTEIGPIKVANGSASQIA